jgi:hypothetical protein
MADIFTSFANLGLGNFLAEAAANDYSFGYGRNALDWASLGILVAVALIIFYGIIAIHDIPYEISKKRNHPHQDAIHVAGWVSLFTLHVIWPFLWIWATLYREDRGWGFSTGKGKPTRDEQLKELQKEMEEMRAEVARLKENTGTADASEKSA